MLKPQRIPGVENKAFSAVAVEAGSALIYSTQPTGGGVGAGNNEAILKVEPYTGAPGAGVLFAGIAVDDVVAYDLSVVSRNVLPETTRVTNEPFNIDQGQGVYLTNKVTGTPAVGGLVYLAANSTFGVVSVNSLPAIGVWVGAKDSDGYAKIMFN